MLHRKLSAAFGPSAALVSLPLAFGCSGTESTNEPEAEPWNGNTYLLDIAAQDWYEPRGIGTEIDAFVPSFLLRVDGEAPEVTAVTLGTADDAGAQDACNATSVMSATAEPPAVLMGPSEYSILIRNEEVSVRGTVHELTITDVLPDGDRVSESGEFSAMMDFRELYPLFTLLAAPTPESVCELLLNQYEKPCTACPNDGEPWCLTVRANSLGATRTEPLVPVTSIDDPACVPSVEP